MIEQLQKENEELKRVARAFLNALEEVPFLSPEATKLENELWDLIEPPVMVKCISYHHGNDPFISMNPAE